jgi:hypothetical protein
VYSYLLLIAEKGTLFKRVFGAAKVTELKVGQSKVVADSAEENYRFFVPT